MDYMYKELALDAAVATLPETQQHSLRMIALGEQGMLTDLRKLNVGRPTGTVDILFDKLSDIVEAVTDADDRRHNVAHMSEWLSLGDLIKKASASCPAGNSIPSKATVRLQFAPRNPYNMQEQLYHSHPKSRYSTKSNGDSCD